MAKKKAAKSNILEKAFVGDIPIVKDGVNPKQPIIQIDSEKTLNVQVVNQLELNLCSSFSTGFINAAIAATQDTNVQSWLFSGIIVLKHISVFIRLSNGSSNNYTRFELRFSNAGAGIYYHTTCFTINQTSNAVSVWHFNENCRNLVLPLDSYMTANIKTDSTQIGVATYDFIIKLTYEKIQ